jgi:serine protease
MLAVMRTPLRQSRTLIAGASLLALSGWLAFDHADADDPGLAAEDITPELVQAEAQALLAEGDVADFTGAVLVDFVEPEDGEGGSEDAIADLAAQLDAVPGIEIESAGFYSEGEHLMRLHADSDAAWTAASEMLGSELVEGWEHELYYSLPQGAMSAADGTIPAGPSRPEMETGDPEAMKGPRMDPDDPMFPLQWHMEQVRAPEAWAMDRGNGDGAIVAIIDTGVAWKDAHGVKALPDLAGTKFVPGESFVPGLPEGLDDHAHGSHVAGTVAQTTNNGVGVTGVAWGSTIMPLKVLSKDGRGSVGAIANAIRYAADHDAHVINMSLGGPLPSSVLAKAIEYAHKKGVTTVCAAGNERRSKVGYPAANKFSVAVAATDFGRGLSFYSNWGKDIDVAAPGGDTRSDKNGDGHPDGVLQNTIKIQKPLENDYLWFQGTSMASPHAAGVAGLVVGAGVTNPDEVERILKDTAVHPQNKDWDERFGAGIVDAAAAVKAAHKTYAPERAGLLALLAMLGLGGLGLAGMAGRRAAWLGAAGLGGSAILASGAAGTTPIAYAVGGLGGIGAALWLSAAVPLGATLLLFGARKLRPVLAGVSLGWAALLAHGALVLPTLLDAVPGGPAVDRLWLGANAVLAMWLAARVSRR